MIGVAIDSILKQTFQDFEIVLVDDGSKDETESVVKNIPDRRIRYFKKINEERSIARNFGIQHAEGRYINFLDSDDKFYSNHLETAYHLLSKNHFPEIGHLGYEMIDGKGNVLLQRSDLNDHIEERMLSENILHGNAIFIQRSIALLHPFPNHREAVISEDWCVWMSLIARYKIHYDNTITSTIIEHGERSLRNINPDRLIASTEIIVDSLKRDKVFTAKYGNKVHSFFANQFTLVTLVLSLTKHRRLDTIRYLLKAIRYDFTVVCRKRFLASLKHWF